MTDEIGSLVSRFAPAGSGRVVQVTMRTSGGGWGQSWRHGDDVTYPPASLSKVPLTATALLAAHDGLLDLGRRVGPDEFHCSQFPSVTTALTTPLTLGELATLSIVLSDNPAAHVLLEAVGETLWARGVAMLGCPAMTLPVGYRDQDFDAMSTEATTVDEQVAVLRAVDRLAELAPLRAWMGSNLRNGRINAMVPPPHRFHHKTGSLDGCLHDVGILDVNGQTAMVVALTKDQSDPMATEAAMAELGRGLVGILTTS